MQGSRNKGSANGGNSSSVCNQGVLPPVLNFRRQKGKETEEEMVDEKSVLGMSIPFLSLSVRGQQWRTGGTRAGTAIPY